MNINVEDKKESRIHFYFPRVFGFIDSAIFNKDIETKKSKAYKFYEQHKEEIKSKTIITRRNIIQDSIKSAVPVLDENKKSLDFDKKSIQEINELYEKLLTVAPINSNRVLIHCAMGISRSASIVIMYIMKKFNVTLESVFF